MHSVGFTEFDERQRFAAKKYGDISDDVLEALASARKYWSQDWLKLSLFTAEGDWLHQAFDCVILGPYGRADLSPRDVEGKLPALEYYRDRNGGKTRDFVLPCSGEDLKNDTMAPYTCGSDVRRSIIKSFVRDVLTKSGDSNGGDEMKNAVAEQVHLLFNDTQRIFSDVTRFGCACPGSSNFMASCCSDLTGAGAGLETMSTFLRSLTGARKAEILNHFVPDHIRKFQFSQISNSKIGAGIIDKAFAYVETDIWSNHSRMTSYDVKSRNYKLTSQQKEIAVQEGLFQTTRPLTTYAHDDAFQETTTSSAFEVCMGAVSQVMFTMPVVFN